MGRSSKAALDRDEELASLVDRSRMFVKRCRRLNFESCAEIAGRCKTGPEAAAAILRALADSPA